MILYSENIFSPRVPDLTNFFSKKNKIPRGITFPESDNYFLGYKYGSPPNLIFHP